MRKIKMSIYAKEQGISRAGVKKRIEAGKIKAVKDKVTNWWFILVENNLTVKTKTK